jgi:hypothetical protein
MQRPHARNIALPCTLVAVLGLAVPPARADILDFEDVSAPVDDGYGIFMGRVDDGYRGFDWYTDWTGWGNPITPNSAAAYRNQVTLDSGYKTAIPVGTQAMFIPSFYQSPSCLLEMKRSGQWSLHTLRVAGAWRSELTVEFAGFRGAQQVASYSTVLGASGILNTLTLDFIDIDSFVIRSSGGSPFYAVGDSPSLIIDDINYSVIPAPGGVALLALAGFARRRAR